MATATGVKSVNDLVNEYAYWTAKVQQAQQQHAQELANLNATTQERQREEHTWRGLQAAPNAMKS